MPIDLLVDTGASQTALLVNDLYRIGVDINEVPGRLGGTIGMSSREVARRKTVDARLMFVDDEVPGGHREMDTRIDLMPDTRPEMPSVLGRDILNQCECVFNSRIRTVNLRVL